MATLVLSAVGMSLGASVGGAVLGVSAAAIGQAAGATVGRMIDQRILGSGSAAVETGRVDRFRITGAGEGNTVGQVYGRMRVPGQVIWATQFQESSETTGGGKGAGAQPKVTEYSYTVSLAVALCEGTITRVGRVWADGVVMSHAKLNMTVYDGSAFQSPDPKIVAVEGADNAPAYRGIAYVVFEDLPLAQFGNRVPQFTFEVMRPSEEGAPAAVADIARQVRGVALIPGTGEYALATQPVRLSPAFGEQIAINVNSPLGGTDFYVASEALREELPNCHSALLVVSWFGNDLRCGDCEVAPKVEQTTVDGDVMPWVVSGQARAAAGVVPLSGDRPVYGGTPCDASVVEAIKGLKARLQDPVFYPFILMEQQDGNTLINPWTGGAGQPPLPWRGRITTSLAPQMDGTPDQTATATAEVAAFMGTAQPDDFAIEGETVTYTGPKEWRYRRFILHYAYLCKAAGGVTAFCIGSEMRSLTQIRGAGGTFPAVDALIQLAGEVRAILGPDTKISYASDWSEYHGYQPTGTGDKIFHLDLLWADPNIDFIGIDNYMPLSDWRDGVDHADADAGSIYNLDYLSNNVTAGEGYDWYYKSDTARDAQRRSEITDGFADEPWIYRYKDLPNWWGNAHYNRIDGIRSAIPTPWQPQSKPIWFTELGCAAIDKGTNQPNKFLDPKSSESQLPHYSNGRRDDFMQMQYLRAIYGHYADVTNNPVSALYDGSMVDMYRAHVWAWDARPYPYFPGNQELWSDGDNYTRGHWLNGRSSSRTLASVVADICERSGVTAYDVTRLYGLVRGYHIADAGSARAALQPLMTTYGFEAAERDGTLVFTNRTGQPVQTLTPDTLAFDPDRPTAISQIRAPLGEIAARVQFEFIDAEADFEGAVTEISDPEQSTLGISRTSVPLALTRAEAQGAVGRWLAETRVGQDGISFALPPSQQALGAGDVIELHVNGDQGTFRIDRVEDAGLRLVEATRVDPEVYLPQNIPDIAPKLKPYVGPVPVQLQFLDLPLITGDENPHAPHVVASGRPWPGQVALYTSGTDSDYTLDQIIQREGTMGQLVTPLQRGPVGTWDRQDGVTVKLIHGTLSSAEIASVLSGAGAIAIGDGSASNWEVLQFTKAIPVSAQEYQLSGFLRGQAGTSAMIPDVWPAGSAVVVLNGAIRQINVASTTRGTDRHFRYGPASEPLGDASYRYDVASFAGNGLRPYPVAHLRAQALGAEQQITWIRQTRIDGDDWSGLDVPLGEERETYLLTFHVGGVLTNTVIVSDPTWTGPLSVGTKVSVAQVSDRYGAGPAQTIEIGA
ncbi:hypothetical protein FHS72_001681 [Loktanella ponticola]|uniref:Host specificity protein n=1 Tax=Yoonia ponticola TaxID=1524255 RepID=A0A7W9BKN3_9RHOB|nr:glycoside hydrolase/phage tail family protein [Yoonia ponticola]MBB5722057.1 hypothetical protein [Yoonia ponticola]